MAISTANRAGYDLLVESGRCRGRPDPAGSVSAAADGTTPARAGSVPQLPARLTTRRAPIWLENWPGTRTSSISSADRAGHERDVEKALTGRFHDTLLGTRPG